MVLIYVACFFFLLYFFLTKNNSYWQSRGIPFNKPSILFGSLRANIMGKENLSVTLDSIYREHDTPYVGFFMLTSPTLLLRSPEVIKRVLVKDFDKFTNRNGAVSESADPLSYHSLVLGKDNTWKNLRTKISPVFTSGKMKLMHPLMKECAEDMRKYLDERSGTCVEMADVVKRYSVDVISSCAFGVNSNCFKEQKAEMLDVAQRLLNAKSLGRNFALFCFFFAPQLMKLFRLHFADPHAENYLEKIFKNILRERDEKGIVRNDLVDLLKKMKEEETNSDSYKFDDMKMAAQALVFFIGGQDTTSLTLSFALYELTMNKDIQERLRKEVTETFEKGGDFTYESIHNMKYLDMVLNETLRKYPLTVFLSRDASTDYKFEETGLTLEKGMSLFVSIYSLHHDSEYFPNPENFDPERFSDENKHSIKPYTYLPFGDGPRICIGKRFAQTSAKTALAYLLKDYVFEPTEKTDKVIQFETRFPILQAKNGVDVKVTKLR